MNTRALFGLSILMSATAFGIVVSIYLWPRIRRLEQDAALGALIAPHIFRFIGLSFLVPGVVSPTLPAAFAVPAAYGDMGHGLIFWLLIRPNQRGTQT